MPNITDVSTFTDPIDFPGDGDAVTSASVLQYAQDLANRTRYLKDKGDKLGLIACYRLSGSAVAVGSKFTINTNLGQYVASGLAPTSDVITVPASGLWKLSGSVKMTDSRTTNPQTIDLSLYVGGVLTATFAGQRESASASVSTPIDVNWVMNLTAGQTLDFRNGAGSGTMAVVAQDRIVLELVNPA